MAKERWSNNIRKKKQWRIHNIYKDESRNFSSKTPKQNHWFATGQVQGFLGFRFINLVKGGLMILISVLIIFTIIMAAPPTSPYNPGETLDPSCTPGDTNCTIAAPVLSTRTINTILPLSGGGDLSADRTLSLAGLSSLGTANQLLGVNSGVSGLEYKTLSGTSNQISISHAAGSLILSAAQDIASSSSPTFAGLTLTGNITIPDGGTIGQASGILIAFDDNDNYLEITGGNVGIGTTSPSEKLHVVVSEVSGATSLGNAIGMFETNAHGWLEIVTPTDKVGGIAFTDNDAGGRGRVRYHHDDDDMEFWVAGAEKMKIDSNGNVGIGTTGPGALLHVSGGSSNVTTLIDNNYGYAIKTSSGNARNMIILDNSDIMKIGNNAADGTDAINFRVSDKDAVMYIDSTGNVGIGTTSPDSILHVAGTSPTITIEESAGAIHTIFFKEDVNTGMKINYNGSISGTLDRLEFIDRSAGADTKRMVIQRNGNVGIGTTSPQTLMELYRAGSNTNTPADAFFLLQNSASSVYRWGQRLDTSGNLHFDTNWAASDETRVTIQRAGNVGIGTTGPGQKLDLRDGGFGLSDADVAHGMTDWASTETYGLLEIDDATEGGLRIWGFSDVAGQRPLVHLGIIGNANPTDTVPAIELGAGKKNVATIQALGAAETVLQVENWGTDLVTILGNGNVGIGTTSPASLLEVAQASDVNTGGLIIRNANEDQTGRFWMNGNTLHIQRGATDTNGMVIDINGNVGIGTTAPDVRFAQKLDIAGGANYGGMSLSTWSATDAHRSILDFKKSGHSTIGTHIAVTDDEALGSVAFRGSDGVEFLSAASITGEVDGAVTGGGTNDMPGRLVFATTPDGSSSAQERMRIDSSGNVGIGTTSPLALLSLQGTAGSSDIFTIASSTGANLVTVDKNGNVGIGTTTPGSLLQVGNGTDNPEFRIYGNYDTGSGVAYSRLYFDANGFFNIGTEDSGREVVFLDRTIYNDGMKITDNDELSFGGGFDFSIGYHSDSDTLRFVTGSDVNSNIKMTMDTDGNVGIGTTTPFSALTIHDNTPTQKDIGVFNGAICADNNGTTKCYASLTAGNVYGDGSSFEASDLAENYPVLDKTIEPGDVVVIASNTTELQKQEQDNVKIEYVKDMLKTAVDKSRKAYDNKIIGVVSTQPGVLMGDVTGMKLNTKVAPVALAGRVPVKVILENGAIKVGDPLTSSSKPGFAMKATKPCRILGYALEGFDGQGDQKGNPSASSQDDNKGKITAFVEPGWYININSIPSNINIELQNIFAYVASAIKDIGIMAKDGITYITELITDKITTKQLCIEDVCINKEQLRELLKKNHIISDPTPGIEAETNQVIEYGENSENIETKEEIKATEESIEEIPENPQENQENKEESYIPNSWGIISGAIIWDILKIKSGTFY